MRQEVIKHSAAIQIANTITLLQRQTWNILLAYAYDDLPRPDVVRHSIPVDTLIDELQITTRNVKHLKEALRVLRSSEVEWNVLDRDNVEEWGIMGLLAEATIKGGVCTYAYPPSLRERLYNPRIYAKVKLAIQCKFSSKHALALYELACDFRGVGQTPWIKMDEFRRFTDATGEGYATFSEFRRRVLDVAVQEINRRSDLLVEPVYDRAERGRVQAVQLLIAPKQEMPETARPKNPVRTVRKAGRPVGRPPVVEAPLFDEPRPAGPDPEKELRRLSEAEYGALRDEAVPLVNEMEDVPECAFEALVRLKMKKLLLKRLAGDTSPD